ncbi:MAG: lipoprotein signal peptidase [Muribaculaceae bacterium]|nr:lipoprotein signal peptidase [Muribaculaceae bacterium]
MQKSQSPNNELINDFDTVRANARLWTVFAVCIAVIVIDQLLKIWVKTSFYMGEDLPITSWFHLKFIENNGMAFGLELWNKFVLTFGRIIAVGLFIWFVFRIRYARDIRMGFYVAIALITAGAAGNIFDCVFYGVIFNNPFPPRIAEIFPPDGGYAGWFEGRVVDMLYFPFFDFYWPEWIPGIGGSYFEFFQYIFNIADASICVGVCLLIFFYSSDASKAFNLIGKKEFKDSDINEEEKG